MVEKFDRIIVGTDGSKHADLAIQKALSFAKLLGRPMVAIYVVDAHPFQTFPPETLVSELQDVLRKEAQQVLDAVKTRGEGQGVTVETLLREGRPAEELCKFASESDLIVIATHGRRGLGRILLGSVAENVVRHAPCPVLVVRETKRG